MHFLFVKIIIVKCAMDDLNSALYSVHKKSPNCPVMDLQKNLHIWKNSEMTHFTAAFDSDDARMTGKCREFSTNCGNGLVSRGSARGTTQIEKRRLLKELRHSSRIKKVDQM